MIAFVAGLLAAARPYPPPVLPEPLWSPSDLLGLEGSYSSISNSIVASVVMAALVVVGDRWLGSRIAISPSARGVSGNSRTVRVRLARALSLFALLLFPVAPAWATPVPVAGSALVALLLSSISIAYLTGGAHRRSDTPPLVASIVVSDVCSLLSFAAAFMFAGGLSTSQVVTGQRALGLPFGIASPVGLVLFALATLDEYRLMTRMDVALSTIRSPFLLVRAALCVTVFLGGWWFPGFDTTAEGVAGLIGGSSLASWQYGIVCTLLGTGALVAKTWLVFVAGAFLLGFSPIRQHLERIADHRSSILGTSVVFVVVSGFFYIVGLPGSQRGVLGFFEATASGAVLGSRIFGTLYLLVTAAVTIVVSVTFYLLARPRTALVVPPLLSPTTRADGRRRRSVLIPVVASSVFAFAFAVVSWRMASLPTRGLGRTTAGSVFEELPQSVASYAGIGFVIGALCIVTALVGQTRSTHHDRRRR